MQSQGTSTKSRGRDGAGTKSSSVIEAEVAALAMTLSCTEQAVAVAVSGLPLRRVMSDAEFYSAAANGVQRLGLFGVRFLADEVEGLDALLSGKVFTTPDHRAGVRQLFGCEHRWSLAAILAGRGGPCYLTSAYADTISLPTYPTTDTRTETRPRLAVAA